MTGNLEQLLALAAVSGATHAEVYQSQLLSRPVSFEANRLKQLESSQSEGTALRVWKEGCPGLAVAYGPFEPQVLVEKAIALTKFTPPETIELAAGGTAIYKESGRMFPPEVLIDSGNHAIAQIREVFPEAVCSAEFEYEQEITTLINSQGLYCQFTDAALSYSIGAEWVRGEDFLGVYDGETTRDKSNLDLIVKRILQRLNWAKETVALRSGRTPVIFTPNAAVMLWDTLSAALNGKQVLEDSSPWSNRLGEQVIANTLTLSQQPDCGPDSCPFDDEGTLTQTLPLITQGCLQQFYYDRATARALKTTSTGNGFRPSLGRYPTPELVNLVIEPGKGSLEELIEQLGEGLVIEQMLGDGADISGDFSLNIDLGFRIEGGQIIGRVKDSMISGNVYTALKQVIALGEDRDWNSSCYTPSLIVEGLSAIGP